MDVPIRHDDIVRQTVVVLRRELIDVPMFHDQTYGYLVESSSWVLSRPEDVQKLMDLLKKVTADWKSYDDEKPNVMDELRRILTK